MRYYLALPGRIDPPPSSTSLGRMTTDEAIAAVMAMETEEMMKPSIPLLPKATLTPTTGKMPDAKVVEPPKKEGILGMVLPA